MAIMGNTVLAVKRGLGLQNGDSGGTTILGTKTPGGKAYFPYWVLLAEWRFSQIL